MRIMARYSVFNLSFFLFLSTILIWYKLSQEISNTKHLLSQHPSFKDSFAAQSNVKTSKFISDANSESTNVESKIKQAEIDSNLASITPALKKQLWSTLQAQLKNTVVQVIAQVAEFNWIEPYKSPTQTEGAGTAFFINSQGELITNAHVVDQAQVVYIQIPAIGKKRFEVQVVAVSPERDLALLKLSDSDLKHIKQILGKDDLVYLKFGDSDKVDRADKIMALGYPLGQHGLKSTTGVVSGREHLSGQHFIQISAALNKGNSGGPSLNSLGEVIGVNSAIIQGAQNVGYIVPINDVKLFLDQYRALPEDKGPKLIRKPFLGVLFNNASESLTSFLGNPPPGGLYVVEVYKGSPLDKAGVKAGDMIYKLNGITVDIYGEMHAPWLVEEKISIIDYVSRLKLGQKVEIEFYRKGVKKHATFSFDQSERPPIGRVYPGYEKIDYEVIGGLVVMQLTLNHVMLLAQYAPELMQYADLRKHHKPALLITHILLNSPASSARSLGAGSVISQINGQDVYTLKDFRSALLKSTDKKFLTIKTTDNAFLVLPLQDILASEQRLASTYFYPPSKGYNALKQKLENQVKQ